MTSATFVERYNVSADIMLTSLINPKFCKYLINEQDEILDFYYENIDISNNIIKTKTVSKLKLKIPETLREITPNAILNLLPKSYNVDTYAFFDKKLKCAKFLAKSKFFNLVKGKFKYDFVLRPINQNECERTVTFNYKCDVPFIGKKIENIIIDRIKKTNNRRIQIIKDWHNSEEFKKSKNI